MDSSSPPIDLQTATDAELGYHSHVLRTACTPARIRVLEALESCAAEAPATAEGLARELVVDAEGLDADVQALREVELVSVRAHSGTTD
ncbi:hypothetical protein [Halomarina ordinaria]|uniref:ArsR family transcriptional regulator n=1 Tax=Halomarina ordinaria TaxID=3033939 RepID=A0ABD5U719_9EURY|nr:hypothetical protein [Halomarina sp. PSRA2]